MFGFISFKAHELVRPCALFAALCLAAASPHAARARQHEHHGTRDKQPAQTKPAPPAQTKATPVPTPTQTPTPTETSAPVDSTSTHDAHTGHDAHNAAPQPKSPAVQTAPAPAQGAGAPATHEHRDAPASSAPPAKNAAPAPDHSMHGGAPNREADSNGTLHSPSSSTNFNGSLFVMSDEGMGVRVGSSATNVMPMGQMGSGTSWQPASSPLYMWHKRAGEWFFMLHGEVKLGVNRQGGLRGITKFESQNWIMPMAFRRVGPGTLTLRGMFSLEPLTFSGAGSPQLFQTGEVYRGEPIVDAQHPHDLLMELSAQYTMPLGERGTWYAYFGYPGEPALGPVAFMHRMSASENPTAPLGHHMQDSTHIAFGVLTTGFTYRWLKLEGSVFNGREPDEHRYGFEANPWNSRSARVTVAPNKNWAMQFSYGFLRNPEQLEEGDTHRMTASVQYNKQFVRGNWATSLIWGRNREGHGDETFRLNSYLAESTVNFLDRNYLYTRLELADRNNLLRHEDLHQLGFDDDFHPQFRIGAYTLGYARDIWNTDKISVALGGDLTFYSKPDALDALYGRNPVSSKFFVRIRPAKMNMNSHDGHDAGTTHVGHGSN